MHTSDLAVEPLSDALAGWRLDVVVSGSIGAIESVRFIRALRRLGADVTPWLTEGGAQFITATSLAWAAGKAVRTSFAGDASHLALGDALVIAPASANAIGKLAHGITDTPAMALATSYLGAGLSVLLLPNMHDSLATAPAVMRNLESLQNDGVLLLAPRREEGKVKFPEPAVLADETAHRLNAKRRPLGSALVTMGSTRGYIDDVRYVSNYSSGALGSSIAEELYRHGVPTHVVTGASTVRPHVCTSLTETLTNDDMADAAARHLKGGAQAAVLAASVLDFVPEHKESGKIRSAAKGLTVAMTPTAKLIAGINPASGIKVGFKLEAELTAKDAQAIAADYGQRYGLSMMVVNRLSDVDEQRHAAHVFEVRAKETRPGIELSGKLALAAAIARHVRTRLVSLEKA
jgi:phosphopantothenoylcysteine decarboxylase/phosphopantothenate--cysteine ligase